MKRLTVLCVLLVLALPASAGRLPILASQDLWPVFSPDTDHVAYTVVMNGQGRGFALDVVDLQTRHVSRVGTSESQPSPTWSSDGRVAYVSGGVIRKANARGTARYRYPSQHPAFAPAWRPHSEQLAYLTPSGAQNLDLWVGDGLWAKGAIGKPAWSPDGTQLAFQRDGSIWVSSRPLVQEQLAVTRGEPGPPAWAPDGTRVAFTAGGRVYVVPDDASTPAAVVAGPFRGLGPVTWSAAGDRLAYTTSAGVEVTTLAPAPRSRTAAAGAGTGASYAPRGSLLAYAGPVPGCPAHTGIRLLGRGLRAGTCVVAGTAGADTIEGTPLWGDVIRAGAGDDRVHAADRHTDRVDCGAGRDTVWADRTDRLVHCEVVHK